MTGRSFAAAFAVVLGCLCDVGGRPFRLSSDFAVSTVPSSRRGWANSVAALPGVGNVPLLSSVSESRGRVAFNRERGEVDAVALCTTAEAVSRRLVTGVATYDSCDRVAYTLPTFRGASGKDAGRFDPVDGSAVAVVVGNLNLSERVLVNGAGDCCVSSGAVFSSRV